MLTPYLKILLTKASLSEKEAESAMSLILENAEPHQTSSFLSILKYRGETTQEISGMVKALEKKAISVSLSYPVLDIVGTGGDMAGTVNISTGSSILAAACGIPIAKHGNRSVSSQSGSADVLEALGISIETSPERVQESLEKLSIAFMFAPIYHPDLKKIRSIRKELKIPTIFNILGPLLNPAKAPYALIGVANLELLEKMAQTLLEIGHTKRALVFHGSGLDELTPLGKIIAYDVYEGQMKALEIDPHSLGFSPCSLQDLQGGDANKNAAILLEAFAGKKSAVADALIFNTGAALWIFNKANSLLEGICLARVILEKGKALELLEKWKIFSKDQTTKRSS